MKKRKNTCPKCEPGKLTPLTLEVLVGGTLRREAAALALSLDQCGVCGGVWFDAGELGRYFRSKPSGLEEPHMIPALHKALDSKVAPCPRCGSDMVHIRAPHRREITADLCRTCGGLWLDGAEIEAFGLPRKKKASLGYFIRGLKPF